MHRGIGRGRVERGAELRDDLLVEAFIASGRLTVSVAMPSIVSERTSSNRNGAPRRAASVSGTACPTRRDAGGQRVRALHAVVVHQLERTPAPAQPDARPDVGVLDRPDALVDERRGDVERRAVSRSATVSNRHGSGTPERSHGWPDSTCAARAPGRHRAARTRGRACRRVQRDGDAGHVHQLERPHADAEGLLGGGVDRRRAAAMPSSTMRTASFSHGEKNRLTMKPYESVDAMGVLPITSCSVQARRTAAGSVAAPATTSTRRFFAGW